jgi:hypothetical protein
MAAALHTSVRAIIGRNAAGADQLQIHADGAIIAVSIEAGTVTFTDVTAETITATGTTDSTSPTTGAITTAGGLGVAKSATIGETLNAAKVDQSWSVRSGALADTAIERMVFMRTTHEWWYLGRIAYSSDAAAWINAMGIEADIEPTDLTVSFRSNPAATHYFKTNDNEPNPNSITRPNIKAWTEGTTWHHIFIRNTDGGIDGNPTIVRARWFSRYNGSSDWFGVSEGVGADPDGSTSGWNAGWVLTFDSYTDVPNTQDQAGTLHLHKPTASVDETTGALIVAGGMGVLGNITPALPVNLKELVSATNPAAGYLSVFAKTDGLVYSRDSTGVEEQLTNSTAFAVLADSFTSQSIGAGTYYADGFYEVDTNSKDVGSTPHVFGDANSAASAHIFLVSSGVVTGTGVTVTVTGTSYDDNTGLRTATDSEVLTSSLETSAVNEYFETAKKFIGQVNYVITGTAPSGGINIGAAKYQDAGDVDFNVVFAEGVGLAGASDSSFNLELLKHSATGWTYAAAGFVPGNSVLVDFGALYSPENQLVNAKNFAFKRVGMIAMGILGSASEGIMWRITCGSPNSVQLLNLKVGIVVP